MAEDKKVYRLPLLSRWLSSYSRISVGEALLSPKFSRRFLQDYKEKGAMQTLPAVDFMEDEVRQIDNSTYTKYAFNVINLGRRIRYHVYDLIEEWHPEVSVVLDTIADEICIRGLNNQIFDIVIEKSDNTQPTDEESVEISGIKTVLETFLFKTLDVSKRSWDWARNMVKYGDWFIEPIIGNRGVIDVKPFFDFYNIIKIELPNGFSYYIYNRESDEATQASMGMARDYPSSLIWQPAVVQQYASNIQTGKAIIYYDGEIIHFRLSGKPIYQPYGTSHLDSIRNTWEILKRMEDAVMIYRMVRAPERKVFYIATGKNPPSRAIDIVNKVKNSLKRKPINSFMWGSPSGSGTEDFNSIEDMDKRFRFVGIDEDYWIPVPAGGEATKIDTLPGATNLGDIEDLSYFKTKMYAGLRVPKAYLAQEEDINRATLSQQDVRFARLVTRFQESLSEGLEKLAIMQLYAHFTGMSNDPENIQKVKDFLDKYSISLRWTAASFIEENARFEGMKLRAEAADTIKNTFGESAKKYIAQKIFQLTPEEEELLLTGEEGQTAAGKNAPSFGELPSGEDQSGGLDAIGDELGNAIGGSQGGPGGVEEPSMEEPAGGGTEPPAPANESRRSKGNLLMEKSRVRTSMSPIGVPGHSMSSPDVLKFMSFVEAQCEGKTKKILKDHTILYEPTTKIGPLREQLIRTVVSSLKLALELSNKEYNYGRAQGGDPEDEIPNPPEEPAD
jgi:hypothetical protein